MGRSVHLNGIVAPIDRVNVDTDQTIPAAAAIAGHFVDIREW